MAQVKTERVSPKTAAQAYDQIADALDDIVNVLERIARAVEASSAAG